MGRFSAIGPLRVSRQLSASPSINVAIAGEALTTALPKILPHMPTTNTYENSAKTSCFDPDLTSKYATALYAQGKYVQAKALCSEISAADPSRADALMLLATIAFHECDYESALDALRGVARLNWNQAIVHFNIGVALRELGRFSEEIAAYNEALAVQPRFFEALFNRGTALHATGHHRHALSSFDKALEIKPDCAEAFNNRGNALGDLHCYSEALASFNRALDLKPDYAQAYNNRGNALEGLGRYDEALQSYQWAQRLAANYADAH